MARPSAAVAASPTIRLKNTAAMIFQERSASQRMIRTPNTAVSVSRNALSLDHRELVVIHRHLAGEIDGGAEFVLQVQIGCRAVDPFVSPCVPAAALKNRAQARPR